MSTTDEDKKKRDLSRILGIDKPAVHIGAGIATLAGIVWQASNLLKAKSFMEMDSTQSAMKNIADIQAGMEISNRNTEAALEASFAKRTAMEVSNIRQSLQARGITDTTQADVSTSRYKAGLSGAYAAAKAALGKARVGAEATLSNTLSTYYQGLAKKQFESQVQLEANKMGIWGTLGGATGAVIDRLSQDNPKKATPAEPTKDIPAPPMLENRNNQFEVGNNAFEDMR